MKIELAPVDYYFYRPGLYTIQMAFEYPQRVSTEKIRAGLQKLVKVMPVFGSRIMRMSNFDLALDLGYEIPIREQTCRVHPIEVLDEMFDVVLNAEDEPLIKILVNQTPDASIVSVSFSHVLGDGASFFLFMRCLSRMVAQPVFEFPATVDRSSLKAHIHNDYDVNLFADTGYITPRPHSPESVALEYVHYSFAQIEEVKEEAKNRGKSLSSNDVIMADLALKFQSSIPRYHDKFIVRCPVDYRKIMGLGEHYFGNAVRDAVVSFHMVELENMTLIDVASSIRNAINHLDTQAVSRSLTALDQFRRQYGVDGFQNLGCPGLLVSNLSKFPISEVDLGSGPPRKFHHASLNPRLALILSDPDGYVVKLKIPAKDL